MSGVRRPRILMTTDAVGGVWTYVCVLARLLVERGCELHLVTLGPRPKRERLQQIPARSGLALEVTDLALEWMDPQGDDFPRAMRKLAEIGQRVAPDLVHINGYREALAAWACPSLVVAHSCVLSWWQSCREGRPSTPEWISYEAKVGVALASATQWVAPTRSFRDTMQALYAPPTRGGVIANGIDPVLGIRRKEPFILTAGRMWDEAKNVMAIAAIARRLEWPVRIAGALDERTGEEDAHPADASRRFLGNLPRAELIEQMRRAAIFVSPALYEPFGLSVLEAASAGCALVLSDIPTFRELWSDAAVFVPPRDEAQLAAALDALARDDDLRFSLQRRAIARAARFGADRMADAYLDAYRRLLNVDSVREHPAKAMTLAEAAP